MQKHRFFKSQIAGSSGLVNDPVTEAAHEGRNDGRNEGRSEGRNEGRNEAINETVNEAVNGAVNDTVNCRQISFAALSRHITASWRNNCRYECRNKDMAI